MWEAWATAKVLIPAAVGAALGLLVGIGGGYTWGHWNGTDEGRAAAIAEVREQDAKAIEEGARGRDAVAVCRAVGGVWNQSTGKCDRR